MLSILAQLQYFKHSLSPMKPVKKTNESTIAGMPSALQNTDIKNPQEETAFTGHKNSEEYITHLAAIVECSDDAIISKSLEGVIKSWNRGGERMFGYTAEEAIGRHISMIIPPGYIEEEKKILERIRNNEIINHFETVRTKKNGDQFYVSLTVSPLRDSAGHIIGVSKIARDITLSKEAGEALVLANRELAFQNEEKEKRAAELIIANKELESFSYSVSHDLRAPLRAVNGYARMLEEDYEALFDDEGKRLLGEIQKNASKMGTLIDDLLAFSRLGRKEVKKSDINMEALVKNVLAEIRQASPFKADVKSGGLLPVKADYALMVQVITNLLSNAIKYSSAKENALVEISSRAENGNVIYAVKDNGVGFDMQYEHKLFGVFQRLHSAEEFPGTGVGLAIVQRIIHKHGGKIWAEAKLKEGAVFSFSLPNTI